MSWNMNNPKRRCWNDWQKDLQALAGVTDVSKDDLMHRMEQTVLAKDPVRAGSLDYNRVDALACDEGRFVSETYDADAYAAAECADGLARERNPREISE